MLQNVVDRMKKEIILGIILSSLYFITGSGLSLATPLLLMDSLEWTESSPFFVANCEAAHLNGVQTLKPKIPWENNQRVLDWVYVKNPKSYFFLKGEEAIKYKSFQSNIKTREASFYTAVVDFEKTVSLYRFHAITGKELESFIWSLNCQEVFMNAFEVIFNNHWHTLLFLTLNEKNKTHSKIFIFDITQSNSALRPIHELNRDNDMKLKVNVKPEVVRLGKETWYLILAGTVNDKAGLIMVPLSNLNNNIPLVTEEDSTLTSILPLDSEGKGQMSALYALDNKGHLWSFSFHDFPQQKPKPHRLLTLNTDKVRQPLIAMKDILGQGIRLYFLAKNRESQEALMSALIEEPMNLDSVKLEEIQRGNFYKVFPRWGRLILLPSNFELKPSLLSFELQKDRNKKDCVVPQLFKREWQNLSHSIVEAKGEGVDAQVLWDKKLEREVIIRFNHQCKIKVEATEMNHDKLGRITWRLGS